ncbi:hypothetical protein ACQKKX_18255 [Neorhizobium sp. NPDC001467]|uniref:hypothetical protein n=1 Tax=Neorhizobium sp. NPDC001467 TaxID=3390595 RepID=UPI003D04BD45
MRTRWDEVDEVEGGSSRFLGFSAVTWALAVPVAFIAGAAVASFLTQPPSQTAALAIPAPVASESAKTGEDSRAALEKGRWENEAREAVAKAAELQMQVEALRDQVSDETRLRQQAEQAVEQRTNELGEMRQAATQAASKAATSVAVSNLDQQGQAALSYVAPAANPAFDTPSQEPQAEPSSSSPAEPRRARATDDSVALQRIIEDTASRSAALSDRRDEAEDTTGVQSAKMPRRDGEVETALGRATGLDTLSASQRSGLKGDLVAGACVSVSLERVFGTPVPVVPLRNLVRDLDSDC